MGIFSRFFSKSLRADVENCNRVVGMVIAHRLIDKYILQYGEGTAAALASAVANELFGVPPGNEVGRQSLASNSALVDAELRAVKDQTRICQMVSMLAHTKLNIAAGRGTITPEMVMWAAKLRDLGILLPADQIALPSSPDEMRQQVREFELWSLQLK